MSVDPASASHAASAHSFLTEEDRASRSVRSAGGEQARFELPELSPRHRSSAHAQADAQTAIDQARERQNADGLSDEKILRSDARQLQANERQARQVELKQGAGQAQSAAKQSAEQAPAGEATSAARQSAGASGTQATHEAAGASDSAKSAQAEGEGAEKAASAPGKAEGENVAAEGDEGMVFDPRISQAEKAFKKSESVDVKPVSSVRSNSGTNTATEDASMLQAPTQQSSTSARRVADEGAAARMGLAQGAGSLEASAVRSEAPAFAREQGSDARQGQDRERGSREELRQGGEDARVRSTEQPSDARQSVASEKGAFQVQSSTQAQNSQGSAQSEMISNIMRQIERFRESGRSNMQVNIPLPDGQELRMVLRMNDQRVQVKLDGATPEINDAINEGWADLTERAARSGIRLESPLFFQQQSVADDTVGDALNKHA